MRSCPLKWLPLTDNSVSVQVDLCTFLLSVLMIPYTCLRQPLLRSWRNANVACASSSAFVRLSSPFHENSLVTQHTSAGLFHHRKTARGADPRSSSETCVMCEVVLLACWNWCSGVFVLRNFPFSPDVSVVHPWFFSLGLQLETN